MGNKNYIRGRKWEYDIMEVLRTRGLKVVRTSGSHGEFDVIGYRVDQKPIFIQCKVCKTPTEGKALIKKFKEGTTPSKYYHQAMYVKAGRGMVSLMEVTV